MLRVMDSGGAGFASPTDGIGVASPRGVRERVLAMCPYLAGEDGGRAARPDHEHRCAAVAPPAQLALDKQRRLCLTDGHRTCATFLAARAATDAWAAHGPDDMPAERSAPGATAGAVPVTQRVGHADRHSLRWWMPSTAPIVLERGRPMIGTAWARARRAPQIGLASLMVVAVLVLVAARLSGAPALNPDAQRGISAGAASPSAPIVALASTTASLPTVVVSPTPSATAPPSPIPSLAPSAAPTATPTLPATGRSYTVQSGDTVGAIATRFGSTVKAIAIANHMTDPRVIHVGQVLIIP